jgi:hypothetical protein
MKKEFATPEMGRKGRDNKAGSVERSATKKAPAFSRRSVHQS